MSNSKLDKLDNTSVIKSIFIMAFPVILGNMAMVIYNLTDAFFIGQLQDVPQLAAASFAYPLMMVLSSIGLIFGIGGSSYLSRSLGAGRKDLAIKTLSKALFNVVSVGIIISVFSLIFIDKIVVLLGATDEAAIYTRDYIKIILLAAPIIMMNSVSIDMIRAEGAAKLAMVGIILGVTLNIILDPIFIFTLGLGVKGAACATVIGNTTALLFSLYCYKYKTYVKVKLKSVFEKNSINREIIKVGLPAALNIILMSIAIIMTNNIANSYGEAVVAGMGLALRNHTIVIYVLLGFTLGAQPLIGYNFGKANYLKMKKLIYTTMGIVTVSGTILATIFFIFAEPMISIFNSDPDVIHNGARGLRALLLMKPIISVFMVSMSSVQAMGKGMIALVFSVLRQLVFFMAMLNLLNYYFGYDGFIYAQAASDFIMIIFSGIVITIILSRLTRDIYKSPSIEARIKECRA